MGHCSKMQRAVAFQPSMVTLSHLNVYSDHKVCYPILCRFLLGHHKAAVETYQEASTLSPGDWVSEGAWLLGGVAVGGGGCFGVCGC